jgi:hypothetical protein
MTDNEGNVVNYCTQNVTYNSTSGSTVVSGGKVELTGESSCGGETYIEAGGVTYISPDGTKKTAGYDTQGAEGDYYTTICKDNVIVRGLEGMVELLEGGISCSNNLQTEGSPLHGTPGGLDYTIIDKGSATIVGMDSTRTYINGGTFNQSIPKYTNLGTYIYPGVIQSKGASAEMNLSDGGLVLSTRTTGTSINILPHGLPANTYVYFKQIDVCVDGKTKKAWVLMSDPK